jgi:peptidyl-prolyl cis-trans isomerase D
MISWIQRTFQHHFRTVFGVLLAVTIISFIVTIGAGPGIGRGDRRDVKRDFFGYNLASQEDMGQVMGDASLSIELQVGYSDVDQEQVKTYALDRVAALKLADQWAIPPATATEITDMIKGLRIFAGADGQFDATRYNSFRDSLKVNSQTSEADIARVIGDQVRVQKVQQLLDGPGYVLPADVRRQLLRTDTSWTIATATVDYAGFSPAVSPADAALQAYYKDNAAKYQIPPRILASYVDFPAADFVGTVKVTDAEVRSYYDANAARFPAPAAKDTAKDATKPGQPAAKPKTPDPAADFAAVRPAVETALKVDRARDLAAKAASDVAFALYEGKLSAGPAMDSFFASRKLALKPLAPFSQEAGPAELGGSPDIADAVAKLDAQHTFSEAVGSPSGAAIIVWKGSVPARQPALAEVRDKVRADYIENEKRRRFVELGRTLRGLIETRMKAGDTFAKAAAAAQASQGVKIEVKTLPAFTLGTRPQDLSQSVTGALEHMEKGQVSDMVEDADKGTLVAALDKKTPDLSEKNPRFAEMRDMISSFTARQGASSYLSEIVAQELKRTEDVVK